MARNRDEVPDAPTWHARVTFLATVLIALVWLINGLFCKVLNLVPRHRAIVARILGDTYATPLTLLIGLAECLMVVWVVSRIRPRLCAYVQIGLVLLMNVIEVSLAPDLLLFGRANVLVALIFTAIVYFWGTQQQPNAIQSQKSSVRSRRLF